MEELWPNQSPASALNSLHQTLHFVRRDIAPWREGGATADYVALDSEVIYLDPELVQVDSVAFMRQATDALAGGELARDGVAIAQLYAGRFAPIRVRRLGRRLADAASCAVSPSVTNDSGGPYSCGKGPDCDRGSHPSSRD